MRLASKGWMIRHEIFEGSAERLSEMATRAIHTLKCDPNNTAMVAIHVDDPAWADLAEALMPGHDWQQYRDRGELPIARGTVTWTTVAFICAAVPALNPALSTPPPDKHLYAFVMASGGASLYSVPYERS